MKYVIWGAGASAVIGIIQFSLQFFIGLDQSLNLWSYIIPPFLGNSFSQAVFENPSWLVNVAGRNFFRAISFFPDPHMFSFYLGLSLPWALSLYYYERKEKIYFFIFLVILAADLLTFSRGGYIGIIAGIIFSIFVFWDKISIFQKRSFIVAILTALLLISIPNPVSKRFLSSFILSEGSNQERIATWKQSIDVIGNNIFTGVGLGNYPLEVKPSANYREPIYSHSLYLDIAAETGIINILIWITLIAFSVFSFIQKAKRNPFFLAGAIGLVIFSFHAIFETPIFSVRILPLLLILISLSSIKDE